jgi:hypothetical protein
MDESLQQKHEDRFIAFVKDREAKRQSLNYCLVLLTVLYHRIVMKREIVDEETTQFIPSLFWSYCFPEEFEPPKGPMEDDLSDLTENDFGIVLDGLEKLETAMRVPYQPDGEEPVSDLMNYVHVAACRALLLKKRQRYSDDVRWILEEAYRTINRFERAAKTDFFSYVPSTDYECSFAAVVGLVQIEVARLRAISCKYQEALGYFAAGLSYLSCGTVSTSEGLTTHKSYIPQIDVDPQEVADVFENLRCSTTIIDWGGISYECEVIGAQWEACLRDPLDTVRDWEKQEWPWNAFWHSARGFADARLEPSELLEQMKRTEDEQARQRLTAYSFDGNLWAALPERARRSLIEAERAWFYSRLGRVEGVANNLRIATEEVLHQLLWEPLCRWTDSTSLTLNLLDFKEIRMKLPEERKEPGLVVFCHVLRTQALRQFLVSKSFSKADQDFLLKELPDHIRKLNSRRNRAEHDIARKWDRAEVAPLFRTFMGIDCVGVLPRLAGMLADAAKRERRITGTTI